MEFLVLRLNLILAADFFFLPESSLAKTADSVASDENNIKTSAN